LYDFPATPADPRWSSFSPFVIEVEHGLRLAQLPFEHERVSITRIKELNPLGQLPVLKIGTELVADSTRILHRIEALAPGALTRNLDGRGVAEAWLWEEFADTALYPHVLATRWADERGWQALRRDYFAGLPALLRPAIGALARRSVLKALEGRDFTRAGPASWLERLAQVLDALEARAPAHDFWLGSEPTVADVGLFAHLHSLRLPSTPWQAQALERRQRLLRWLERVEAATSGGPTEPGGVTALPTSAR
jgi:glutathione S-transferase